MENEKIPKIIHYCWFGKGKKSEIAENCINGWKVKLPEYTIIEWNEDNFDLEMNQYVKQAYKNKKYAFVSDYVRLHALFNYGGIYLDTDVEVVKEFNEMLNLNGFVGFEDKELVSTATIGAKKGNKIIEEWLKSYKDRVFENEGKKDETTNVRVLTNILLNYGMKQNNSIQNIGDSDDITVYPIDYFSPLKIGRKKPNITKNTVTIHWFEGTWLTMPQKIKIKIIVIIKYIIGFNNYNKIKDYIKNRNCYE